MKGFPTLIILSALLALASCGKENESGRNNQNGPCLMYGASGCSQYAALPGGINYGIGSNANLSQIISQIPCESQGYYGGMMMGRNQPITMSVVTNSMTTAGHAYVGVTSMGDVLIIVGSGGPQAQATLYSCQGQMPGQQASQVLLGEYVSPTCPIKTVTAATFGSMKFRDPRGGRGINGGSFSFCQREF